MRGSPSPVNGAGPFLVEEEKVRSLERADKGQAACLLKPCSLGIRGFESHPPHLNIVILNVVSKIEILREVALIYFVYERMSLSNDEVFS